MHILPSFILEPEQEPPKPQPTVSVSTNKPRKLAEADVSVSIDVTDYSSMADQSDDKLSQSRTRGGSAARRRPREKRKATGIIFEVRRVRHLPPLVLKARHLCGSAFCTFYRLWSA